MKDPKENSYPIAKHFDYIFYHLTGSLSTWPLEELRASESEEDFQAITCQLEGMVHEIILYLNNRYDD